MNWRALWLRVQSLGFWAFLAIVGAAALLLFVPLWARHRSMQRDIQRLDAELIRHENIEKQQKGEIDALKTDPAFVESTARDKLNLVRPNETFIVFTNAPSFVRTNSRPR